MASCRGLMCRWDEVREGEAWRHSAAWVAHPVLMRYSCGHRQPERGAESKFARHWPVT